MMKHFFWLLLILSSCAQFVPPTGGPKDETPPELVQTNPPNETRNFKGQTLVLEFNELIDATSLRQELIITPEPDGAFDLKEKANGVELKFDKPFKDSTTYTFNFRNGIKDLSEKNPAQNLKLVFSTGSEIDSLDLQGKITNLWSGQNADQITVGLYNLSEIIDTIPLLKNKPGYFIKTDTSGQYNFENLKGGKYRVLAFKDENQNLLFDPKNELFSFLPDTLNLDSLGTKIDMAVYPNNTEEIKVRRSLSRQGTFNITFNKPLRNAKLSFSTAGDSLTYKLNPEELIIFPYPNPSDTTLTKIIVQDSTNQELTFDQKVYFSQPSTNTKKTTTPILLREQEIRNNTKIKIPNQYQFNFEFPITSIDTSKITVVSDTIRKENFKLYWQDSSQTQLQILFSATAKEQIKLTIESGAITNYKSDTNDTYTLINTLYQQQEFGSIDGSYPEFTGQKIIELIDVDKNKVTDRQIFTDEFFFPEVIPGTYKIRIIEDSNANGYWDTASFDKNTLPERIKVSNGIIKVKENFQLSDIQIQ